MNSEEKKTTQLPVVVDIILRWQCTSCQHNNAYAFQDRTSTVYLDHQRISIYCQSCGKPYEIITGYSDIGVDVVETQ